jgi:hypothetical protein
MGCPTAQGRHRLEAVSKSHLTSNSGVAAFFKMITYQGACSAFSSSGALLFHEKASQVVRFADIRFFMRALPSHFHPHSLIEPALGAVHGNIRRRVLLS